MSNAAAVSCSLDPGMSQASVATITKLYDMSRPGIYTVQVSQPASGSAAEGLVKSKAVKIKVQ